MTLATITKAKKILGWEPRVPLDEGLSRTIEYFRRVLADVESEEAAGAKPARKVGVWTKADSVTYFDALSTTPLGRAG